MNFFDHKDPGNHLLQVCPKVVKHPVHTHTHTKVDNECLLSKSYLFIIRNSSFRLIHHCVIYRVERASLNILANIHFLDHFVKMAKRSGQSDDWAKDWRPELLSTEGAMCSVHITFRLTVGRTVSPI